MKANRLDQPDRMKFAGRLEQSSIVTFSRFAIMQLVTNMVPTQIASHESCIFAHMHHMSCLNLTLKKILAKYKAICLCLIVAGLREIKCSRVAGNEVSKEG